MVRNSAFGLEAYIAAIVISNFISVSLNLRTTIKTTGMAIEIGDWLIKPIIACVSGIILAPAVKMLTLSVVVSPVRYFYFSGYHRNAYDCYAYSAWSFRPEGYTPYASITY